MAYYTVIADDLSHRHSRWLITPWQQMTYQITRADEQWTYYTMTADDLSHHYSRWLLPWQQVTYYTTYNTTTTNDFDSRWLITQLQKMRSTLNSRWSLYTIAADDSLHNDSINMTIMYYTIAADDSLHHDNRWLITPWQQMIYYSLTADEL